MEGDPKVIAGLVKAREAILEAFCWLHDQEHKWEVEGFDKLEDWFDDANRDLWDLHHKLLKRIYALGGTPEGVVDDAQESLVKAATLLEAAHKACQEVYEAVDEADDYVTEEKLASVQKVIEGWLVSADKRIKQIRRLKPSDPQTPWLSEQL